MQLEKGKISSLQLTLLVFGYLMGSSTLLTPGAAAKNNAWLALIVGFLEASVFAWTFLYLMNRYPERTLVEINDQVLGPYLGKIISLFYLWYFSHIGAMVLRNYGDFFNNTMVETPLIVFLFFILLICAVAAAHGLEVICRSNIILIILFAINFMVVTVFITPKMDLSNLLPFMDLPVNQFLWASHSAASFPFGEIIAFSMIIPYTNQRTNNMKCVFAGLALGLVFYLVSALRTITVLGSIRELAVYPVYSLSRLVDVAEIINRVEILIALNLLMVGFLYITVVYYGTVLGLAQILKLRSYKPLIFPIGLLILNLSILQFDSTIENLVFTDDIYPYYSLPFEFLLPFFTLLIAAIRKFPGTANPVEINQTISQRRMRA